MGVVRWAVATCWLTIEARPSPFTYDLMADLSQHTLIYTEYGYWNVMRGRQLLGGRTCLAEALALIYYFSRLHRAEALDSFAQSKADR
ncbi:hypothetical protein ABW45_11775 [Stenotrophomonas maltophilia]|nr:hypothetical protein ABW45_11775 [Stenotrophomonas maltophilia]